MGNREHPRRQACGAITDDFGLKWLQFISYFILFVLNFGKNEQYVIKFCDLLFTRYFLVFNHSLSQSNFSWGSVFVFLFFFNFGSSTCWSKPFFTTCMPSPFSFSFLLLPCDSTLHCTKLEKSLAISLIAK